MPRSLRERPQEISCLKDVACVVFAWSKPMRLVSKDLFGCPASTKGNMVGVNWGCSEIIRHPSESAPSLASDFQESRDIGP